MTSFVRSERFGLYFVIFAAIGLLVFKGSSGEGQANILGSFVRKYTEETSASIIQSATPSVISEAGSLSLIDLDSQNYGQDEFDNPSLALQNIQGNSVLASNPSDVNYLNEISSTRTAVETYVVKAGDLLSTIAGEFKISTQSIMWANGLKDADSISPGQTLRIPPVTGVIHKVNPGDTVKTLAQKYSVEDSKIIAFNTLPQDGNLQAGVEIMVPDGKMATPPPAPAIKARAVASTTARSVRSGRGSSLPDLGSYFMVPASGFNWGRLHGNGGVDIATSCGNPVYAAAGGTVTVADNKGYNGGFGQYIVIRHPNGTETLYGHSSKLLVSAGQGVGKGQQIMKIGSTGRSTGCHVHFEVHGARNPAIRY